VVVGKIRAAAVARDPHTYSPPVAAGLHAVFLAECAPACNHLAAADDMDPEVPQFEFEARLKAVWLHAQAGDEAAYHRALMLIAARLRAYFARRLRAWPDEVEDLVQETLLALHVHRATCDPNVPVSAWVHAIARHKLVDLWRRRGRREALHDPLDESLESTLADEQPARHDLRVLLATLPDAQRRAIELIKIDGLSVAEASARSGVSVSALKVQVHRGLRKLAALVRDRS
jgi:RNA polymerase sigma-70 factor (ECF subfamily)